MKKVYLIITITLLLIAVNCKREDNDQKKSLITFNNIQGNWLWDSIKYVNLDDTIVYKIDSIELRIYSIDTCEFYDYHYKSSEKYLIKYKEPDTLALFSCSIGALCDPYMCWENYKIIEFDKTKKMVIKCDRKSDKCGTNISIRYFSKPK